MRLCSALNAVRCRSIPGIAGMTICLLAIVEAQQLPPSPSPETCEAVVARVRSSNGSDPTIAEARAMGIAASKAGVYGAADTLFGAILEFHPDEPEALYYRALALFNLRRVAEAERLARA